METVTRREALLGAAGLLAVESPLNKQSITEETYERAKIEWAEVSKHGTVAFRVNKERSHFVDFEGNAKSLTIAIVAGMNGWTLSFKTSGEQGGYWRNVQIIDVEKS